MSDRKVAKGEKITWDHLCSVDSDHHLRVRVKSPYGETISSDGEKGKEKVEITMSFSDGTHSDVHLITSFSLVYKDGTETPVVDPGPNLVIDTIGPPIPTYCPEYEDKPVEDDYECEEQH